MIPVISFSHRRGRQAVALYQENIKVVVSQTTYPGWPRLSSIWLRKAERFDWLTAPASAVSALGASR